MHYSSSALLQADSQMPNYAPEVRLHSDAVSSERDSTCESGTRDADMVPLREDNVAYELTLININVYMLMNLFSPPVRLHTSCAS